MTQKKILFVANVAKEHLNKFHGASVQYFQSQGWRTDIACKVDAEVPFGDHIYNMRLITVFLKRLKMKID